MNTKSYKSKLLNKLPLLFLFIMLSACQNGRQNKGGAKAPQEVLQQADTCTLLFAGDIMSHTPQIASAYRPESKSYDFHHCFDSLRPLIQSADLAVANLETTLAGKPYRGYPMFSAPDALAQALKDVGFDVLGTSNNHSADRGRKGVVRTLDVLDSLGLKHFGSYRNARERKQACPLILEVKKIRIALLAYTYGLNGMPIPKPTMIDTISKERISLDLDRADSLGADYKIVFIHWGQEYEAKPNQAQRSLAQWLHQQGVNAIIGSHPHVPQESVWLRDSLYQDTFVLYSLGNFISNQRTPSATRGGLILRLRLVSEMKETASNKTPQRAIRLDSISYDFAFVNKKDKQEKLIYRLLPISLNQANSPKELPQEERLDYQNFVNYCNRLKFVHSE